jgi:DNA-binding response OmpR family regulator
VVSTVRVLVAEQDETLGRILDRGLRAHGFEVASVDNVEALLALVSDVTVGLVILDLPDMDEILRQIQQARPTLPVLRLTVAEHARDLPRSEAAGVPAPSPATGPTLRKPFAFEQLIARIRALTRQANERQVTTLTSGDLRIDLLARCAWRGERAIDLPDREFALLEYFVRHPGRVLSRQAILTDVWGYHFDTSSNVVDVYVRYLRNKLDRPGEPSLIASVRGAGYRFDGPPNGELLKRKAG